MKKLIMVLLLIIVLLISCSNTYFNQETFFSFDTVINITLFNDKDGEKHINEIKNIFNEYSRYSSDYNGYNNSSIYDLNQNREISANEKLKDMLIEATKLKDKTNGYFNPFIGRLSHIWKDVISNNMNKKPKDLPSDEVIKNELKIMNETSLVFDNDKIKLNGEGNIDLGAFAKGYVCNIVYEYLVLNNIKEYLIDAGNSMVLIGDNVSNVYLRKPKTNKNYAFAKINNIAISTSSSEHQYFIKDNVEYHHLISPFTGYPVNNYEAVSVFTNDIISSDALSTAIYLMDFEYAKKYISDNNLKAILYKEKVIYKSGGMEYAEEIQI